MNNRELSPFDRLLSGANDMLRTTLMPTVRTARDSPSRAVRETALSASQKAHAAGLMRVNHAGEVAAQALYKGHAAVARDADIEQHMQDAAAEELDHLAWCEQRIRELGEEPSRLSPVWYAGAYAIGAASGILGDKWSLGFIAETERQVCEHLDSHLARLPEEDVRSRAIIAKMRDEEAEHGKNAIEAGAVDLPGPLKTLMRFTAKLMTKSAYWV